MEIIPKWPQFSLVKYYNLPRLMFVRNVSARLRESTHCAIEDPTFAPDEKGVGSSWS